MPATSHFALGGLVLLLCSYHLHRAYKIGRLDKLEKQFDQILSERQLGVSVSQKVDRGHRKEDDPSDNAVESKMADGSPTKEDLPNSNAVDGGPRREDAPNVNARTSQKANGIPRKDIPNDNVVDSVEINGGGRPKEDGPNDNVDLQDAGPKADGGPRKHDISSTHDISSFNHRHVGPRKEDIASFSHQHASSQVPPSSNDGSMEADADSTRAFTQLGEDVDSLVWVASLARKKAGRKRKTEKTQPNDDEDEGEDCEEDDTDPDCFEECIEGDDSEDCEEYEVDANNGVVKKAVTAGGTAPELQHQPRPAPAPTPPPQDDEDEDEDEDEKSGPEDENEAAQGLGKLPEGFKPANCKDGEFLQAMNDSKAECEPKCGVDKLQGIQEMTKEEFRKNFGEDAKTASEGLNEIMTHAPICGLECGLSKVTCASADEKEAFHKIVTDQMSQALSPATVQTTVDMFLQYFGQFTEEEIADATSKSASADAVAQEGAAEAVTAGGTASASEALLW